MSAPASRRPVIYLDWNATTPPHADVLAAMQAAHSDAWANPASTHGPGRRARAQVERAREAVATLVRLHPRDVTFTSGGTEANNLALGIVRDGTPWSLLVSRLEHPSVVRAAERLEALGTPVVWVAPDASGQVLPDAVAEALERVPRSSKVLVSLQAVNHETGVVQPVAEVVALAHARGGFVHVDAVQAVGRLRPAAWEGADLVSVASHKLRGPKGVGAVATIPGIQLRPVLLGGAQERGMRPGTQDAVACAGFAVAAERSLATPRRYEALAGLRDAFEADLIALGTRSRGAPLRNGTGPRAPHVSNLSWPLWRGDELCAALDLEGVAVSSGAACSAGTAEPSPVLTAMLGEERARGAVRVSLGEETTAADLREALERWALVLSR